MIAPRARVLHALLAAVALTTMAAFPSASAQAQAPAANAPGAGPTPLEQAREESAARERPRTRHDLPAGELRLSRSELLAAAGMELELSLTLARDVAAGRLEVTLPRQWIGRSGVSDLPYARVPSSGRAVAGRATARRSDGVVALTFDGARKGDVASFTLTDNGIPAGTYRLPYRWSEGADGSASGQLTVIFYKPVREAAEGEGDAGWTALMRDVNATNDAFEESETFVTVVPGNRQRFIVGINGGGGYNAWITNNGGASFTKAPMPASIDAPAEAGPEAANLCCDPMSAADTAGNIWYGGVSRRIDAASPSRIVVGRVAPAATSFVNTVGLPERTNAGTQDKPMMTIDNSPASPAFGRLYVIWGEPTGRLVMSVCDTRPGGVPNPANCDGADSWTAPASVTPPGSFIYADVATGPDGKVYAVWWDYSATNAIRGEVCDPATENCAAASGWGTPQTIATLDATGGAPLPFACPIEAQPGGRASPSPQVEVDRSSGPNSNRVYVTWSDLRTGSGTTRCGVDPASPAGNGRPPQPTHLTWDVFVASAAGALPGGAARSPSVATRLITDGEGDGQANADDWFAWLAVDQTSGQAWADFYSTRDDATRNTTNFYVRKVTPDRGGHLLGPPRKVSTQPSNYSANPCCTLGNDYGDYTGIDATSGVALPVWTDRRAGLDGEAFIDVVTGPVLVPAGEVIDDPPGLGGNGNGVLEPRELIVLTKQITNIGTGAATGVTGTLSAPAGFTVGAATSTYPDIAVGATQANSTGLSVTMDSTAGCGSPVTLTLALASATDTALIPITIPTACRQIVEPPPPPVASKGSVVVFRLTGSRTQQPLRQNAGLRVTLSCPLENCAVTLRGTVTVPATRRGAKARNVTLKSRTIALRQGRSSRVTFKLSRTLRAQLLSRLRRKLTRTKVSALFSARAVDGAGNRATRRLTVKVRR